MLIPVSASCWGQSNQSLDLHAQFRLRPYYGFTVKTGREPNMKCPVCDIAMKSKAYGGQTVDVCGACAGIWCDDGELSAVVKALIGAGKIPKETGSNTVRARESEDHDHRSNACPRCERITESFNFAYVSNIFLNRCTDCRGIWLDGGELRRVAQFIKNASPE